MGTTIDALINGEKKGYAPSGKLVTLYTNEDSRRVPDSFDEAVFKLKSAAKELLHSIEQRAETPIAEFTIGKSFARKIQNKNFDPSKFNTWIKKGLSDRWRKLYEPEGYNGLIALCAITREILPLANKGSKRHTLHDQQQYALALEQQLIHFFAYVAQDRRLGNKSLDKGALAQNPYAGVVYLAFRLLKSSKYILYLAKKLGIFW